MRQAIINGLSAATSPALAWNDEVRDKLPVTAVVRTSDNVATVTLVAAAAYNITANETITDTVPTEALVSGDAIIATPTFDVIAGGGSLPIFQRSWHRVQVR